MLRPSIVLAAIAAAGAVEDIDRPTVDVGGFPLLPMANLTAMDHRLELHPKALIGVGYNSNLFAEDDAVGDAFWRVVAGAEGRWRISPRQLAVLDAELESQQYLSEDEGDLVGGRGRLAYAREGQDARFGVESVFRRSDRPQDQTGEQIAFDEWGSEIEMDWRGRVSRVVGAIEALRIDYREDSAQYGAEQRDAWRYGARLRFGRSYARESQRYVRTAVRQTLYDGNERFQDSVGGVLALGIEHLVGTRTLLFADLGVDLRQYEDDFAHDDGYDDAQSINPVGSLGVRWSPEPLSGGIARLVADVYDSVSSNSAWYYGIEVDGRLRLAETIFAFIDLGARNSIDSGADAGGEVEERLLIDLGGGMGYALRDGAACRVRIGYTISDAVVDNDYDRLLAAFEMGIVF